MIFLLASFILLSTLDLTTTPTFFPSAQFALFPWKKKRRQPRIVIIIIYNLLRLCASLSRKDAFRSFFLLSEWHWLSFIIKRAEKAKASQQRSTWDCFRSRLGSIFSIISVHSLEGGFSWYFIIMGFFMMDARRLIAKEGERCVTIKWKFWGRRKCRLKSEKTTASCAKRITSKVLVISLTWHLSLWIVIRLEQMNLLRIYYWKHDAVWISQFGSTIKFLKKFYFKVNYNNFARILQAGKIFNFRI